MGTVQQHFDALLLALASSTDNFTVGLSVGLTQKGLPFWANALISICNASGAWMAGQGGLLLSHSLSASNRITTSTEDGASTLPLYLSAVAFGILAVLELHSYLTSDSSSSSSSLEGGMDCNNTKSMTNWIDVWKLAIPMTLNNLAGGVAGGAAGLLPETSAIYALLASFITMAIGHRMGLYVGKAFGKKGESKKDSAYHPHLLLDPTLLSALLLGTLCIMTFHEALVTGG